MPNWIPVSASALPAKAIAVVKARAENALSTLFMFTSYGKGYAFTVILLTKCVNHFLFSFYFLFIFFSNLDLYPSLEIHYRSLPLSAIFARKLYKLEPREFF